ncbi:MAG TPA: hypothetical protein VMV06_00070 [Acidimicrobiales bacterium]|nr:hypothetical protein [Acidimicrobiales bacterium]HVB92911.1 hypothetical protein [Acidimicrobiales bacterium]
MKALLAKATAVKVLKTNGVRADTTVIPANVADRAPTLSREERHPDSGAAG